MQAAAIRCCRSVVALGSPMAFRLRRGIPPVKVLHDQSPEVIQPTGKPRASTSTAQSDRKNYKSGPMATSTRFAAISISSFWQRQPSMLHNRPEMKTSGLKSELLLDFVGHLSISRVCARLRVFAPGLRIFAPGLRGPCCHQIAIIL